MTVRDFMASWDARILSMPIVRDRLFIGQKGIDGAFFKEAREVSMPGGELQVIGISFDCRFETILSRLSLNDVLKVEGHGNYRFLRELLPGGDESGMTTIELGELL